VKQALKVMGLLILITAIKAGMWISNNGPPSFSGSVEDIAGLVFVIVLVGAFLTCLILTLVRGRPEKPPGSDVQPSPLESPSKPHHS
jgi:hypothetical protein